MRNRAKCKLCGTIIESYTVEDYVMCKCEEIAISGGLVKLECYANDFANFMRVDDMDNEIVVSVKDEDVKPLDNKEHPGIKELMEMFDGMIDSYERMPKHAILEPVSHADMISALLMIRQVLREFINQKKAGRVRKPKAQ